MGMKGLPNVRPSELVRIVHSKVQERREVEAIIKATAANDGRVRLRRD